MFCQNCNGQNADQARFCRNCGGKLLPVNVQASAQRQSQLMYYQNAGSVDSQQIYTGIEVKTDFFPLAFLLFFCTPIIEINGQKNRKSWGMHFFAVQPGEYYIRIYFPYLFMTECGANNLQLRIVEGEVRRIHFNMPPWMFAAGTIKVS